MGNKIHPETSRHLGVDNEEFFAALAKTSEIFCSKCSCVTVWAWSQELEHRYCIIACNQCDHKTTVSPVIRQLFGF